MPPPSGTPAPPDTSSQSGDKGDTSGNEVTVGDEFKVRRLQNPSDRLTRSQAGKRSYTKTDRKRGRYVQARPARNKPHDIAFDATFRAAAPYQRQRDTTERAIAIEKQDLREKVRVRRTANLIMFSVDASWSMAAAERMEATKGAIMSLLMDAYQRRDQVGLVVFQKETARLVLPPTSSVELAKKALSDVPVGGKTPLSAGLYLTHQVLMQSLRSNPELQAMMILLTDGAGNVSMSKSSAMEEAHQMARQIREDKVRSVVINMEHPSFDRGLAQALADELDAPCYTLAELKAETLYETVKDELR